MNLLPGQIIILNGAPRSGKTSIVKVIMDTFDGIWMNVGVDRMVEQTPEQYKPGIGLRPGGERPDLEPFIRKQYRELYETIAGYSRAGVKVVVDVDHHDDYSKPLGILYECARILKELPVLFVGVRCPVEVIMQRRIETGWNPDFDMDDPEPEPVRRWQKAVHDPGIYDLEVDTSKMNPDECARKIRERLEKGSKPDAFKRLAKM